MAKDQPEKHDQPIADAELDELIREANPQLPEPQDRRPGRRGGRAHAPLHKKVPFQCRMPGCESTDYEVLTARVGGNDIRGPGGVPPTKVITGFECKGCTVRFSDPEKFSKQPCSKKT